MGPKILLLLCFAAALGSGYCEPKSSDDEERARLPEFLTELDLASLEASEEDIEALKTVVKRLAPEKNGVMGQPGVDFPALTTIPATTFSCRGLKGGYYADLETNCQVFHICDNGRKISFLCPNGTIFQQSQLICDWWFKVDCSKSAELYEQSAEQLAAEERKRSDAKRMKSEFHRSSGENEDNSSSNNKNNNSGQQNYYQSQNSNYDGRQNGRTNPFGETSIKNQIPGGVVQRGQNTETKSSTRAFDPSQIYGSNSGSGNQYNQINDLAASNIFKVSQDANENAGQGGKSYNARQQQQQQQSQTGSRSSSSSSDRGNYRPADRQQNQLVDGANREEKRQFNYEQRGSGKFGGSNQNSYQNHQQQTGRANQQSFDYSSSNRNGGRDGDRRNFGKSIGSTIGSSDYEVSSNRVTPSYTETTTFRTSTASPIREYQQLAESAAFASNRGNRFNDAFSSSQFNSYYSFNSNGGNSNNNNNGNNNGKPRVEQKPTEKPRQKSITPTPAADKTPGSFLRVRGGSPALPFPTFQPIYKPRTSNSYSTTGYETTTLGSTVVDGATTTNAPYTNTDYYGQNNQDRTTYTENLDYTTTASYQSTNEEYQSTTESGNTETFTENYQRNSATPSSEQAAALTNSDFFENTTPTIITSGSYVNAKAYTSSKAQDTIQDSGNYKNGNSGFTTVKPYSKTQEQRQNSVATAGLTSESSVRRSEASSSVYATTPANYRELTIDQGISRVQESRGSENQQGRASTKSSPRTNASSAYRSSQNSISTSTEKPSRSSSTVAFQQSGSTGKTLSPYDTSITYQQGKVMSTLGPYVPFTKNYAYSTTTTSTTPKPPAYTATVPTYSSTASNYRSASGKSLGGKVRVSSVASSRPTGRVRGGSSAAYLPEKKSDVSTYLAKKHSLSERPPTEREHAMSMLQSLRGLEGTAPSVLSATNSSRSGLNIPASSGPSTLHSLALYFATASDDFDATAESRTDSAMEFESGESISAKLGAPEDTSVELPKSILTQHTINSYTELFNLNNALEGNSSVESIEGGDEAVESGEESDDLDIQQSEGPVDGARRSNSTKLRELAQVFTHALSAYLQDPDTFKKILTEIRPTEPALTTLENDGFTATTFVPTTSEDYPSVTKEKDEVLDFSDDTAPPRGRRPTTIYPVTTTDSPLTTDAFTQQEYYTTSVDHFTTSTSNGQSGPSNDFAFQVNHAFGNTASGGNELSSGPSGGLYYPEEATGPSGPSALDNTGNNDGLNDYADNYFPSDEGSSSGSRIGGFQNNTPSASTYEPYGKHVKPYDATPIGDNYVASSTPATYVQSYNNQPQATKQGEKESQRYNTVAESLSPPTYFPEHKATSQNSVASYDSRKQAEARRESQNRKSPTTEPFRIRYYDPTTLKPKTNNNNNNKNNNNNNNRESLVTAGSVYSSYRDNYNDFVGSNKGITEKPKVVTSVVTSRTVEPATRVGNTESGSLNAVTNVNDGTTTSFDGSLNRQNDRKLNDHWTSSPTVTQLWESTVFVDPKRINQGLVSGSNEAGGSTVEAGTIDYTEVTEASASLAGGNNIQRQQQQQQQESLVTEATSSGVSSRNNNNNNNVDYPSSPWQWTGSSSSSRNIGNNENDSPTAFTLLPQTSFGALEQSAATATPSPIYTTRSSITTTITSSVTSTSSSSSSSSSGRNNSGVLPLRQESPGVTQQQQLSNRAKSSALGEVDSISDKENEIIKAHKMFGKLNTTSTNTLMRVMKQADTNATVRQLVLLLINHCNGPMNKTMEEEKEQLLDALLRMPVNEFTSEESRELVAGINRLKLPLGRSSGSSGDKRSVSTTTIPSTTSTKSSPSTTTTSEPAVTTFRSKKGRRFKTNTEEASPSSSGRNGEDIGTAETSNALSLEDTSASDARALELLRSLYTIAAKWG